jgi:sugar phosphate isomerase/epimerase
VNTLHTVEVPDEKWEEMVETAAQLGFLSVQAYLLHLHDTAIAEVEETVDVAAALRESLADLKAGRTVDIDDIWDMLDDDED